MQYLKMANRLQFKITNLLNLLTSTYANPMATQDALTPCGETTTFSGR